nr:hypothetical protein [Bacillus cereus]
MALRKGIEPSLEKISKFGKVFSQAITSSKSLEGIKSIILCVSISTIIVP